MLAATGLTLSVVTVAVAPTATGRTSPDVHQSQLGLIAAADRIKASGGDGYAGISVSARRGELELRWKGALPATVARAVEQARREVGVRVLPAAHSERELLAVAERLAKEPGVTSVAPKADGSGLTLGYAGDTVAAAAAPAIRDAGVAVDVQRGEYAQLTQFPPVTCLVSPASRQNDACPWGGGATFTTSAGRCTTGWPVRRMYPQGGYEHLLLTAGHCGSDGLIINDGVGSRIGTAERDTDSRDIMLVKTSQVSGRMFVGGWNSNTFKSIRMPISNYPNTLVCTSGAMSGQHCDLRVEAVNVRINIQDGTGRVYSVFPMVQAYNDNPSMAVAQGDSGGPVAAQDSASWPGGGIVYVYAAGTITAGNAELSCPVGSTAVTGARCFRRVFYAPLLESLSYYGITLMTG